MKFIIYISIFIFSLQGYSQTKVSSKLYAKDLKLAKAYFEAENYLKALQYYRNVLAIYPEHETSNLNAVICRINLNHKPDSSLLHLSKIKKNETPEVQFYFGKIYHLIGNFNEAIKCFTNYKAIAIKYRSISDEEVNYNLNCSKNAIELMSQPHRAIIKNVGNNINTSFPEYVPLITPDETVLYFTSKRNGGIGNEIDGDGSFFEDIYVSHKENDGTWGAPKNIGAPINTKSNDACVALSFDGNLLIIYRTSPDLLSGDLYISRMGFNGWETPTKLGPEINTPFAETSACFSTDTSVIYFSSNKIGGFGGKDIYRIKKLPNGRWSMPLNLGSVINTDKDEDAPFLHPDGANLYFSSKGHNTMGEYDVFKTTINHPDINSFSPPENLGFPINSVNNDIFFVLNANGTKGYYSSVKEESFGGSDLYMIDTRFGDNDLQVKQGKVTFGNEANKAKITLIDIESKQVSGIYNANSKTGKFILVLNPLKSYKAIVEEEGFQTMTLDIEPIANELFEKELILSLTKKQ
jgi:hypothetical protein